MNNISISEHIKTRWRDYAEYVIYKRGIPSFYDGLTNVQRVILDNSPAKTTKSMSVVGSSIKSGYAHGPKSLESALNGMAKNYDCAQPLLQGDGFFGTPITDDAAAARYTSVSIHPRVKEHIDIHSDLNEKNIDGMPKSFHVDIPIGCFQNNTGIAVGFKSTILPRKESDIQAYLNGEIDSITPYFDNFGGTVKSADQSGSSWYILGNYTTNKKGRKHQIIIDEIPIVDKYKTFIKKINKFLEKKDITSVKIKNNSQSRVHITLETSSKKDYEVLRKRVKSLLKSKKSENVGFIRDGKLLEYNKFEDYLDDFKVWLQQLKLKQYTYDLKILEQDLDFVDWKIKFIKFMQSGKKSLEQINDFLSEATDKNKIKRIPGYKINDDELKSSKSEYSELETEIKEIKTKIEKQSKHVDDILKSHVSKANQIETN